MGGLQICSTVHVIAILRIYRRSLNDSNQSGNPGVGGGDGGAVEGRGWGGLYDEHCN